MHQIEEGGIRMGKMKKALALLSMMVFLSSQGGLYAQTIQTSHLQTQNLQTSNLQANNTPNTDISKQQLNDYNLFAIGQEPSMQENTTRNLKHIKELNQKVGLKYVLMDIGYAQSLKLNTYLQTQNEALLDEIMEDMYPEHRTEEMKQFFKDLYTYNQQAEPQIEIVGVGQDRKENTVEQVEKLLEPYKEDEEIKKDLELIKKYPSPGIFKGWLQDIVNRQNRYGEILEGYEWWQIQMLLNSAIEVQKEQKNVTNLMNFTRAYGQNKILYLGSLEEIQKGEITNYYKQNDSEYAPKILNIPYTYAETAPRATPYNYNEALADAYIKEHTTPIDLQDTTFKGLKALDKELENHKIFLAGEVHGNTGSYEMQLYLTKYFHEKAGVDIIMIEGCNATGELLNTYIQTGDTKALEQAKTFFKNTLVNTKEFYAFIDALKAYNAQQKEGNKLRIVGIDRVNSIENANFVLQGLFKKHAIEPLLQLEPLTHQNSAKVATQILEILQKDKETYLKKLGKEDYVVIEMLAENLMLEETRVKSSELIREHSFVGVFNKVLEYYGEEKIFAQMGLFHASQEYKSDQGEGYTTAEYLQKYNPATKGEVISILYDYEKGQHAQINSPNKTYFEFEYPSILKKYATADYQLVDLAQEDNPLEQLYVELNDNYITDTFQYYLLMKNTKAAQPIDLP